MTLEIKGLNTHYGLSHVLQGIDLKAGSGEVIGIFGRNGVGKTTLLKTIAGWVKPTSGTIRFKGRDLAGATPDEMCRAGFGFVPEDRRIFPGLTVRENLEMGLLGLREKAKGDPLAEVFDRFPRLGERANQAGTTLSGGEQQMLAMARVMLARPDVVLIDEPSEGLAPMIVAEVFGIIREMRETGAIILLVEQNVHEALAVSDHYLLIERGMVVLSGSAEDDEAELVKRLHI